MDILQKKAITILLAGLFFNLSIGVLYAWSVIKTSLMTSPGWAWTSVQAGWPYTICLTMFALGAFIGGRLQDQFGPRWVVTTGGLFVGSGLLLSGYLGNNPTGVLICFGIITGLGIGLGYSGVTPPAFKWFHASQKGFVSGVIIGGFGFGAVFYAPIARSLLNNYTIEQTFIILGSVILLLSVSIAQLVKNPPVGYVPQTPKKIQNNSNQAIPSIDLKWNQMIKTKSFYLMIILFLFVSSSGMMVVGNITNIANIQAGMTSAFLVSFIAMMNSTGRFFGGIISDKIGRTNTLYLVIIIQAVNMLLFRFYTNEIAIIIGIILAGSTFGGIMSVFPALTADRFGLKYYGVNYGIVYLFWGCSALIAPVMADYLYEIYGNYNLAYIICSGILMIMIAVNYLLNKSIGNAFIRS